MPTVGAKQKKKKTERMENDLYGEHTDYTHLTFGELSEYLEGKAQTIEYYMEFITNDKKEVVESGYWDSKVDFNFKSIADECIELYTSTIVELRDIKSEIKNEVQANHRIRLIRIAKEADKINRTIGKIWKRDYRNKEYGNKSFRKVERIYGFSRDLAVTLIDLANFAERLNDFVGKKNNNMKNNPWISGSFYLFVTVVVFAGLGVLSKAVHWSLLPIIIVAGLLIIGLLGAYQLRNDDMLKEESFVQLIQEVYK